MRTSSEQASLYDNQKTKTKKTINNNQNINNNEKVFTLYHFDALRLDRDVGADRV